MAELVLGIVLLATLAALVGCAMKGSGRDGSELADRLGPWLVALVVVVAVALSVISIVDAVTG